MAEEKEVRMPTAHLDPPAKPVDVAVVGEQTVTMIFPRKVTLTLSNHKRVVFEPGIQEVPVSLSTDEWLARAGARIYTPQPPTVQNVVATAKHVEFLQANGRKHVTDVPAAQAFIDALSVADLKSFNGDFDNWVSGQTVTSKNPPAANGGKTKLPDLTVMTKSEIVEFAKGNFGADLDTSSKKDDLIAAVQKLAADKEKEG